MGKDERSYVGKIGLLLDYGAMLLGLACLLQVSASDQWAIQKLQLEELKEFEVTSASFNFEYKLLLAGFGHGLRASACWVCTLTVLYLHTVFTGMFMMASFAMIILQLLVTLPKNILAIIYFALFEIWIMIGLSITFVIYYSYSNLESDLGNALGVKWKGPDDQDRSYTYFWRSNSGFAYACAHSVGDIRFANTIWMATLYLFSALWNVTSIPSTDSPQQEVVTIQSAKESQISVEDGPQSEVTVQDAHKSEVIVQSE